MLESSGKEQILNVRHHLIPLGEFPADICFDELEDESSIAVAIQSLDPTHYCSNFCCT